MEPFIPSDDISNSKLAEILTGAAIDHEQHFGLYVTHYPFNFWLNIDQSRKLICWWSFWHCDPDADELSILRLVNEASIQKIMVQFSYDQEKQRFYGHYHASYEGGLVPQNFLKNCQRFGEIMDQAVSHGVEAGVLLPLPECPVHPDNTVH